MSPTRYPRVMQALHWLTVLAVVLLFPVGYVMARIEFGSPLKTPLFRLHAFLGYAVLIMTVLRLYYKFRAPQPAPPAEVRGARLALYRLVHALLYVGLLLMGLSGPSVFLQSGVGLSPWVDPGALNFKVPAAALHVNFKYALLALIGVHIVGVVSYQVAKGDVLSRMGLGRGR